MGNRIESSEDSIHLFQQSSDEGTTGISYR